MKNEFSYSKLIDILDYDNPSLQMIFEELAIEDKLRFGLDKNIIVPDSKKWESAMAIKSFKDFNKISPGNQFAGIGAGIETNTFYLASKGCICFPVDRYLSKTSWSDVAPIGMMINPKVFTQLDTNCQNIIPVHSDARLLKLPSNYFDGVYSSGSIEHFGSLDKVTDSVKEVYRILKPGGLASITTEFRLDGPVDKPWFDDNVILFTKKLIEDRIIKPSGLKLIGKFEEDVSEKTYETRKELADFLESNSKLTTFEEKKNIYPNFVLHHDGFLFCSIHLLLEKSVDDSVTRYENNSSLEKEIDDSYNIDMSNIGFKSDMKVNVENRTHSRVKLLPRIINRIKKIIN